MKTSPSIILAVFGISSGLIGILLNLHFYYDLPQPSLPDAEHIYDFSIHGRVVYLTWREWIGVWSTQIAAFASILAFILSQRRRKR
jgi:hypothetical protein